MTDRKRAWNSSRRRRRLAAEQCPSAPAEVLEQRVVLSAEMGLGIEVTEVASIDGSGNNLDNPEWGAADTNLLRLTTAEYGDGISTPAGEDRPSAREVSNSIVAQDESVVNDRYLTDITWMWGQFIDHDLDLTETADPAESFSIEVPDGDPWFDPTGTGTQTISLNRSDYDTETGDEAGDPRQQINELTAFLDGSVIYGSDEVRAAELRTFEGGRLKTSEGDLLPFNEAGLENAGGTSDSLFLAGDVRANENAALTSMHTLWVREHNRIADEISAADPELSDEEIYQQARAIVRAELQAITYNEYLPALLGEGAISEYEGYDSTVNPGISNLFSTASYRFGHTMLSPDLLRLNDDGTIADEGTLALQNAFFAPGEVTENGIDSLLLGATAQQAQEIDPLVIDDVRNFLFGPPGAGGFDLASLNIQRGRDHGLPDYNQARIDMGLAPVTSFAEITSDVELQQALEATYGDVNNIDVWVGGLAEDHVPGSSTGELIQTVLVDQFERIRDGDRFWYENLYSGEQLHELQNTTLADVILRNTEITELQDNVFFDSSVLYYRAEAGSGPADVSVQSNGEQIEVVDQRTGEVLQSGSVGEVQRVMVVGSDRNDQFRVSLRGEDVAVPGGIQVFGSGGERDRLIVSSGHDADRPVSSGDTLDVNGVAVTYQDVESVRTAQGGSHNDRSDGGHAGDGSHHAGDDHGSDRTGGDRSGGEQSGTRDRRRKDAPPQTQSETTTSGQRRRDDGDEESPLAAESSSTNGRSDRRNSSSTRAVDPFFSGGLPDVLTFGRQNGSGGRR